VRALFLLLLLANLLFAAWSLWIARAPSEAGVASPLSTGPASIQLLRELPPRPEPAASDDFAALEDSSLACVSAGPYLDRSEADSAAARLAGLGYSVRLREARDEVSVGQWVRIEGLATPEDAANVQAALQAAGFDEAYVVTDEQAGPVVSLGVYSDAERAASTVAAARAAGFEPRSVDAMRTADVIWLDVDRQASGGLPSPEQLRHAEPARLPQITLRPCPAQGLEDGAVAAAQAAAATNETRAPATDAPDERPPVAPR